MAVKLLKDNQGKYGTLAFITTPQYRQMANNRIMEFVCNYMYSLCSMFHVVSTGGTYDYVAGHLQGTFKDFKKAFPGLNIKFLGNQVVTNETRYKDWKKCCGGLERLGPAFTGMINVIYRLVEGEIQAVIHLKDWQDISAKPDSEVLSREANVHNVPIATNYDTAEAFTQSWQVQVTGNAASLFNKRKNIITLKIDTRSKRKPKALALVAHDKMKLDICKFAVKYADVIANDYKCIIATGTTGKWIKRFLEAKYGAQSPLKVHQCYSGPEGGDLQIANAIIEGWCDKIIFFQDPSSSHPHDSDIRLFEQAVVAEGVNVKMATNYDSAKLLMNL